jgi:AcrR family transcriptional regulator
MTLGGAERARNRDSTASVILEAAKVALAEDGFASFGINAIARRAGADKQLIYRYFGGLDGLIEAVGEDLGQALARDFDARPLGQQPATYPDLIAAAAVELMEVYRANPVLRQIHVWEQAAPSPLIAKLAAARSRQLMGRIQALRGDLKPPDGSDFGALNASIFAAVQQLAIAGCATGAFAGMALRTEEDWSRAKTAIAHIARAAYAAA